MARYRVTITGRSYDAIADLVRKHELSVLHHTAQHHGRERYTVQAIVDEAAIAVLEQAGYTVERHEDVDEVGRQRQQEVAQGNRYVR